MPGKPRSTRLLLPARAATRMSAGSSHPRTWPSATQSVVSIRPSAEEAASVAGGEAVDSASDPPRVVAFRSLPKTPVGVPGCVLMEIQDPQHARTRDGLTSLSRWWVTARPTPMPGRGTRREDGRRGPDNTQSEMTRAIKEAAPRPLAANTLVADRGGWRDPWVES